MATSFQHSRQSVIRQDPASPRGQKARVASPAVLDDKEVDVMVRDLEELRKTTPEELTSFGFCKSNFAMAVVGSEGCRLSFASDTVYLDVPPKAVKKDQVLFIYRPINVTLVDAKDEIPVEPRSFIPYASTVRCGPSGTKFDSPVTVQFSHCALYDATKGPSGLFVMRKRTETSPWQVMHPELFDVSANAVKVRIDEFGYYTLAFPLTNEI